MCQLHHLTWQRNCCSRFRGDHCQHNCQIAHQTSTTSTRKAANRQLAFQHRLLWSYTHSCTLLFSSFLDALYHYVGEKHEMLGCHKSVLYHLVLLLPYCTLRCCGFICKSLVFGIITKSTCLKWILSNLWKYLNAKKSML